MGDFPDGFELGACVECRENGGAAARVEGVLKVARDAGILKRSVFKEKLDGSGAQLSPSRNGGTQLPTRE